MLLEDVGLVNLFYGGALTTYHTWWGNQAGVGALEEDQAFGTALAIMDLDNADWNELVVCRISDR